MKADVRAALALEFGDAGLPGDAQLGRQLAAWAQAQGAEITTTKPRINGVRVPRYGGVRLRKLPI